MKVLRHEEFDTPCAISCNGLSQTPWSKTMVGYGREDENYCLELTYNYGVSAYEAGSALAHVAVGVESPQRGPNPKESSLIRKETSTYKGFHPTFAALFSY